MSDNQKKTIFSGVQPSGKLTLGNYLGAIRNFPILQEQYNCIYCVVDQHAITVRQEPAALRRATLELIAQYIACGLDPEKSILFIQSHVPAHAELAWVLNCFTMFGEASRMTQFKDKSAKHADNINVGLFTYPVLMAADILLYQTDLVPVGVDQSQHIEICRDIANRFNNLHPNTFTIPEGYYPKVGEGAKITSLVDPNSKMSKSDPNPNGYILLMDKPEDIMRKFKRAVTDSDSRIIFDPQNKPGVSNLLQIYALATGKTIGKAGAKIMSLQDSAKKMSKSDENPNGSIYLMDDPDTIIRKFKRAVTDSEACVRYCDEQPGIKNLIDIYRACTGKTPQEVEKEFDGKGYGEFKPAVGEAVVELLRPIREKTTDLLNNKDYLEQVYKEGAQKASYLARKTLDKVYRKVGFVAR